MQYEYVKNPVWDNEEHTSLTVTVKFTDLEEEVEFTAVPDDVEEHGREIWNRCIRGDYGEIEEYVESETPQEVLIERFRSAIQSWMDGEAMKLGYDSILSVCSYINTGNPKFDAEGEGFRQWRSAVWARGYELIDEVIAGQREVPDDPADVIALLPELVIVYPEEAGDAGNE